MEKYEGKCHGGPDDGKMLAHWQKTKKFYRPMVAFSMNENAPVEAVEIGEYLFHQIPGAPEYPPYWVWHSTEQGRAMDKLFGAANAH